MWTIMVETTPLMVTRHHLDQTRRSRQSDADLIFAAPNDTVYAITITFNDHHAHPAAQLFYLRIKRRCSQHWRNRFFEHDQIWYRCRRSCWRLRTLSDGPYPHSCLIARGTPLLPTSIWPFQHVVKFHIFMRVIAACPASIVVVSRAAEKPINSDHNSWQESMPKSQPRLHGAFIWHVSSHLYSPWMISDGAGGNRRIEVENWRAPLRMFREYVITLQPLYAVWRVSIAQLWSGIFEQYEQQNDGRRVTSSVKRRQSDARNYTLKNSMLVLQPTAIEETDVMHCSSWQKVFQHSWLW